MPVQKRKLIEVALPLEAINKESAREKSIRHGHPSTLHLWWARRPLAACRAVLFASLVDDPSSHPEEFPTEEAQDCERQRLFRLIEEMVKWENINNEDVMSRTRSEILRSTGGNPPPVLDPFAGGGSIPLEAQRLGLEAHASDLNPVAVLINKALIEIPPKFANCPPVHPDQEKQLVQREWKGAQGLAEDVRYYGKWMRDEAEKRIGHLYPKAKLPPEYGGGEATVIAWLWARTVKCPNPACGAQMPLIRSFWLGTKRGKQAWIEPVTDTGTRPPSVKFSIRTGDGRPVDGTVDRRAAVCLCCGTHVPLDYVRTEAQSGRMSAQMTAVVAEGQKSRIYCPVSVEHIRAAQAQRPEWVPAQALQGKCRVSVPLYGMETFGDLFTSRQSIALETFSSLIAEVRRQAKAHAAMACAGLGSSEGQVLSMADSYADAMATYLAFAVDRLANYLTALCTWHSGVKYETITSTFGRQALAMSWDFAEGNPFSGSSGNIISQVEGIATNLDNLPKSKVSCGVAVQRDATKAATEKRPFVISTDPPYYDNIMYADLSDFFYVWLRHSLVTVHPDLFATLSTPKMEELVASPYRFAGHVSQAQLFFERGLQRAFEQMRIVGDAAYPLTVYYAFRQSESDEADDGNSNDQLAIASTGWETMLEALIRSGFSITGTWPMRTELITNLKKNIGALASSVVIVCRPRADDAPLTTRRDFLNALKRELPAALKDLQHGNIAPVDLAQASIGPGMAIYSRYKRVLEADGSAMTVRTALALINQALDAYLAEQEGEYDSDTRWALAWFEQYAFNEGPYGDAETLSTAKDTSVGGLVQAGFLSARGGKVRLLRREELPADWNPTTDRRLTVWEVTQQLIRIMQEKGEPAAASLLAKVGGLGETARDLAYRLYQICERKGWAQEALPYNALVVAWSEVGRLAGEAAREVPAQGDFGF